MRQASPQARAVGEVIRRRRRSLGLTLVQVAAVTGLSHPFLSQLERGRTRGSMRSLFLVAEALHTSQQALLAEATPDVELPVDDDGGSARLLAEVPGQFALTEFRLLPREFGQFFRHEHAEMLYVAAGVVEVELPAGRSVLRARDVLEWGGGVPHRWRGAGPGESVVLVTHTFGRIVG
ncbi:helix-turn-helix domain-containing protein [Cryptosporangium phraense]|uniref:XRE family transcriptional regulator n=1 Tax=Cryptosporangium phraense TaxID=2593070 RepID=A0A545B0D6_9ACTN|nr:XRE family transcriptional regulator [Cryptosporangium phraense]TQS47029.1 XRE family transcriptional regulator [Cryptosporangium phraense]